MGCALSSFQGLQWRSLVAKKRCRMKKKFMIFIIACASLAIFANCGNKDDGAQTGHVDMSATCFLMQTNSVTSTANTIGAPCYYNYSANPGFQSVGAGYNNGGFYSFTGNTAVNCPGNTQRAYSPSKGLACVNSAQLAMNGQPVYYDYNRTTLSFTTVSTPALPYGYGQQGYNPYGNQYGAPAGAVMPVLRVCDPTEPCPDSQHCRSPLGLQPAGALGVCYF